MTQSELMELWDNLANVPVSDTEEIETDFHTWKAGTDLMDIWHFFDDNFTLGLGETLLIRNKKQ